ncbi:hypothetical protein FQN57_006825 [Myotisia sp. PD_48]|nr:hypothetical protein FQN57_006825 [Myotisia sp. PD_48]
MRLLWAAYLAFEPIYALCTTCGMPNTNLDTQGLIFQEELRAEPCVIFSNSWQVLGPFQIGTRESPWGADPLEARGGFRTLTYDPDIQFPSSLAINGTVKWSIAQATTLSSSDNSASVALEVNFPEIDWRFLQVVYGWAALQHQSWARGRFTVAGERQITVSIFIDGVLEFRIDNELYFGGDFYSYRRAPLLLTLDPGDHLIELRLVRDVRALGASTVPFINTTLTIAQVPPRLIPDPASILTADVVEDRLISPYASITLQNPIDDSVEVLWVKALDPKGTAHVVHLVSSSAKLAAHQTRAVAFTIDTSNSAPLQLSIQLGYVVGGIPTVQVTELVNIHLTHRKMDEAHKMTFLHPAGAVSYTILQPPLNKQCYRNKDLAILIALHGAGLPADHKEARHMLDGIYDICSWILIPSGVTSWSGDDWHTYGLSDVQSAVSTISKWIKAVGWDGPGVTEGDWIIVGHSNGGQGAWHVLSHYPDHVIAAASVSGYTSIENYVPFTMWRNMDTLLGAVVQTARQDFKHELLADNFAGIPIFQQHGGSDDNVPPYHSRLMHQLMWENNWTSQYKELPGKGHWYGGVLTTPFLTQFYHHYSSLDRETDILPSQFSFVIPPSSVMGSKGGICVDQLNSPDQSGYIHVTRDPISGTWVLETRNIHRFHLIPAAIRTAVPSHLIVDGTKNKFPVSVSNAHMTWYTQLQPMDWEVTRNTSWHGIRERYGRQIGPNAILRTIGSLNAVSSSNETAKLALQTCHILFQYFAADCAMFSPSSALPNPRSAAIASGMGNVITLLLGKRVNDFSLFNFPVLLRQDSLVLQTRKGEHRYEFEAGLGIIFIQPLRDERLEMVIWGFDLDGLRQAARLIPTLTGVGQPDFVIVNRHTPWKGQGALYAAGFFDYSWNISYASYVL